MGLELPDDLKRKILIKSFKQEYLQKAMAEEKTINDHEDNEETAKEKTQKEEATQDSAVYASTGKEALPEEVTKAFQKTASVESGRCEKTIELEIGPNKLESMLKDTESKSGDHFTGIQKLFELLQSKEYKIFLNNINTSGINKLKSLVDELHTEAGRLAAERPLKTENLIKASSLKNSANAYQINLIEKIEISKNNGAQRAKDIIQVGAEKRAVAVETSPDAKKKENEESLANTSNAPLPKETTEEPKTELA